MKADVEDAVAAAKSKSAPATTKDRVWNEIVSWFWVIVAFLFIEGTLVQARVIPSGSMENTVLIGDHLIVSRIGYDAGIPFTNIHVPLWRKPKRQQIIVFEAPLADQGNPDFIKRCMGVPGDHLKIVAGEVYVNGVRLNEPYVKHSADYETLPVENFPARAEEMRDGMRDRPEWLEELHQNTVNGELVVPPGKYFMMGDNRDNSNDGRFWGFVPRENIIGTPVIIYMSIDAPEQVWQPGFAVDRFLTYGRVLVHPGEVRWRRLFHTF
ncbi:MAG TPA: signal peptidase I [Candidatus Acidoferrales bacterium]|nr:signal peptidase I [Candidatus Acidoferrales bacterium]